MLLVLLLLGLFESTNQLKQCNEEAVPLFQYACSISTKLKVVNDTKLCLEDKYARPPSTHEEKTMKFDIIR